MSVHILNFDLQPSLQNKHIRVRFEGVEKAFSFGLMDIF